ncbi:lipopolysaccharide heptosyltransferase I [Paenalcaligenes faecalis]|uniref:lipopolysaccharide heptosyltransferase I n=1 Tax=Paenalcaligenes faecalis TaxID=2980099 RepID=UPI0022B9B6B0|nr:lipopolysaccharide heptosyltransferase I [Paenalcaligenes faecalis]
MSTKILIVRTSSLGDLVHMLPAISDIAAQIPDAQIDWVVEESFAQIPLWHPAVNNVITVAHRRWRKNWWSAQSRAERAALKKRIQETQYDLVLDMQALLKTVWITRMARGVKHGLDWKSAREPLASLLFDVKHRVEFWQPAITRQRLLASLAFNYQYTGSPDYGLQAISNSVQVEPVAMIMPSASRDDKLWPVASWHKVFDYVQSQGLGLRLLAGSPAETQRAEQLIAGRTNAEVLPRMGLTEVAHELAKATVMIGLDSGLTHLSAALERPTIGIYKASTPVRTPLVSSAYVASLGERGIEPTADMVLSAVQQALNQS